MPKYNFEDFKEACCKKPETIFLDKGVIDSAGKDFQLYTKTELLAFICGNGLEPMDFVNTEVWRKNPDKSIILETDAYKFKALFRLGYIAIVYNHKTKMWIIKSFHLSDDRNRAFEIALKGAGF